ncbi:hypothetical protein EAO28_04465 [Klebsiella pneumoniae]|uniref:Uncharacterized protein n=1 Tax=Klebsiella pneumoniae TaxID=573 RepID=A0A3P2EJN5_KLEPN|nr:hypothetical protein EAO28_04465 [Klebsiella pneumoniae]
MGRVTASEASQSPPHRHILRRARTQVRAFFSHVAPQTSPGRQQCLSGLPDPTRRSPATRSTAGKRVNPLTAIF